jgi:chromate reductase
MTTYQVGYFVGSLSSTSINRELSKALIGLAPEELEFEEIPIGSLPLYNPDFDAEYPPEAVALKDAIRHSDGVLSFCNARQMTAPEAYIQYSPELFPGDGNVTDESTKAFLMDFMAQFRDYIVRVLTVLPRR